MKSCVCREVFNGKIISGYKIFVKKLRQILETFASRRLYSRFSAISATFQHPAIIFYQSLPSRSDRQGP
jgi:hypothetical protein